LELFDLETPIEEAVYFAERGLNLDRMNQRVRLIRAYVLLSRDQIGEGLAETNVALAINPNSLIFLENIGYLFTLFGEWNRGPALIRKAIEFNQYYDIICHYALFLDWIRQGDFQQAYLETSNFNTPFLFWDPLMKAVSSGLSGRQEDGKRSIEDLLKLKPDFPTHGRRLIKYYIKFDDIFERFIEGLHKAGLNI
jgi:hypothetical protein